MKVKVFLRSTKIQEILARENKTMSWLSHKIEIDSSYMSQLMNHARNPSPKVRKKMMRVLRDYKFDDLFELKQEA